MSRVGRKGAREGNQRILEISALEKDRTQGERQLPGRGHVHPANENGFCLCGTPVLIEQRPELKEGVRYGRLPLTRLLQDRQRFRDPACLAERLAKTRFHDRTGAHAGGVLQWLDGFGRLVLRQQR